MGLRQHQRGSSSSSPTNSSPENDNNNTNNKDIHDRKGRGCHQHEKFMACVIIVGVLYMTQLYAVQMEQQASVSTFYDDFMTKNNNKKQKDHCSVLTDPSNDIVQKRATPITDEFNHTLSCRKSELYRFLLDRGLYDCESKKTKNLTIAIAYHVGMVKNWKTVVRDQLTTLKECGLGAIADDFMLSYSADRIETFHDYVRYHNRNDTMTTTASHNAPTENDYITDIDLPIIETTLEEYYQLMNRWKNESSSPKVVHPNELPWEGRAMNMIYEYCKNHPTPGQAVVFYFHNKGVSKWRKDWKQQSVVWSYRHSLHWRKYMEYFLLERPQICINKLLYHDAKTCGILWHPAFKNHYSGNFWSAKCDYVVDHVGVPTIETLPPDTPVGHKRWPAVYIQGEFYLGGKNFLKHPKHWHASLSNANQTLYRLTMLPEYYAWDNYTYLMENDTERWIG